MRIPLISNLLGLIGGAVGGVLGYYLFFWIADRGFYGLMIPGALVGLGASMLSMHRSPARGVVLGVAALALGLFIEWKFRPFKADGSFTFLLKHVSDLTSITLVMIAVGGVFAFWMGKDANPVFPVAGAPTTGSHAKPE
jgi:hypothetical protein